MGDMKCALGYVLMLVGGDISWKNINRQQRLYPQDMQSP